MCCCGNEHDNDPPYKTSRSSACCTLSVEIILMVINVVLWLAVVAAGILVCAIAVATSPASSSSSSPTGARRLGEISANRPSTLELSTTDMTTHLINTYGSYIVPGFDSKFTNGDFISTIIPKSHNKGRRLDACDDDEDCSKLKKAGKVGCDSAQTIIGMFWINNLFALLGVIFYSMVACDCCKGCCGGYQSKNKIVMVYSVVASIWGLVQTILHASLSGALNAVKEVCEETGQHPGVVAFINGMATTILICTLFHALCMILRGLSAWFMFKAQSVPHSGDAAPNGGVQAAVVPAQQVVVVQEAK